MDKIKIGILGMGYVGLPLAMALQNYYNIYAYDTDKEKINELKKNYDRNNQFSKKKKNYSQQKTLISRKILANLKVAICI